MKIIFHIASIVDWELAKKNGIYKADTLQTQGFIHCSQINQVIETANRRYKDRSDLVLLSINETKVKVKIKYETPPRKTVKHPHIYGSLNLDAVTKIYKFKPDSDGCFSLPRELR